MTTQNNRVSLAFARGSDLPLLNLGNAVLAQLYVRPEFPNPPITSEILEGDIFAYSESLAAMSNGGKLATATKNAKREVLAENLKKLAYYVQIQCAGDVTVLLASGFEPVSTNRASAPLPPPVINRVAPGMTGQTVLGVETIPNVRSWQAEYALLSDDGNPGEWVTAVPSSNSRKILVENQTPGRVFAYRVRAVGGTNGVSNWSLVVTARAA